MVGNGCEVRLKGVFYSVQRAKGSADEPTVGDNIVSLFRTLACLPLLNRLRHGKVSSIYVCSFRCILKTMSAEKR